MTNITLFTFENTDIRTGTREEDGAPLFAGKDVCDILGIKNSRQAMAKLDDDQKGVISNDTSTGRKELAAVTEGGLYDLIFDSRKPAAKRFRKWVTDVALPALRKDGMYVVGEEDVDTDEGLAAMTAKVMAALEKKIAAGERKIAAQEEQLAIASPKATAYDARIDATNMLSLNSWCAMMGLKISMVLHCLRDQGMVQLRKMRPMAQFSVHTDPAAPFKTQYDPDGTYETLMLTPNGVKLMDAMFDNGDFA